MDTIQILKMPDSSATIALVDEKGGTSHSHKIGRFTESGEILVSNPEGLLYFVDQMGIDKLVEIQQAYFQH